MMRWPWQAKQVAGRLVIAWSGQALAYVQASSNKDGSFQVHRFGVERQGDDSDEAFATRLSALGLKGQQAWGMLRSEQYHLLQIDAPPVAPEELRAAARWKIRDMVEEHLEDLTLDVLRVGEKQGRTTDNLFVITATNAHIRSLMEMGKALGSAVDVIDIQTLAQRNLQTAVARRNGSLAKPQAQAAIVLLSENHASLTISANEELFYKRRIDLGDGTDEVVFETDLNENPDYPLGHGVLEDDRALRFAEEVQRSLDLWDRTWPELPLAGVNVFAAERTAELVRWLGRQIHQPVTELDVAALFPGFEGGSAADRKLCWPLLGLLLRTESRKL